jgi:hypothetical protein
MRVFHYNPETAQKGALIGDIPYAHATSNKSGVNPLLPVRAGQDWRAADHAAYLDGSPLRFDTPVCFCLGEFTCGTDRAWHWVALVPARIPETTEN